ncbi:MAG: hydroxyacid dehydrogenase [Microbacteriaceae bacterium]
MTTAVRSDNRRLRARFAMQEGLEHRLFDAAQRERLERHLDLRADAGDVEVLVTGWGATPIGTAELDAMPSLRAILHAAGTVKSFLTDEPLRRGIRVTSAAAANALPVAEFTLAAILTAGKSTSEIADEYAAQPSVDLREERFDGIGNYGRVIGILGASQIGRRVVELLRPFDVEVLVSDPYLAADDPLLDAARSVPLAELFAASDIVSVHAPDLPQTRGIVSRELLASMRRGAVLINTARPALVDQPALVEALRERRIRAVLDVTDPEPLPLGHPLRSVPGVTLTPHLAGAQGNELRRLGEAVVREVEALSAGRPALHPVRAELFDITA